MQISNETQAVELFCQAATKQADATESGDYQTGNKACEQVIHSLRWLETHHTTHLLNPLLNAPEIGTRLWAASYLLRQRNAAAEETLKRLATRLDIHGFTARMTLQEWRAGRLTSLT